VKELDTTRIGLSTGVTLKVALGGPEGGGADHLPARLS
jgi:hypothetical protein